MGFPCCRDPVTEETANRPLTTSERALRLGSRPMRSPLVYLALAAALGLGGCNFKGTPDPTLSSRDAEWMAMMPQAQVDPFFARYEVADPTGEQPGTIVVNTKERQLYFVLPGR